MSRSVQLTSMRTGVWRCMVVVVAESMLMLYFTVHETNFLDCRFGSVLYNTTLYIIPNADDFFVLQA